MSNKWRALNGPIAEAEANAEPEADRLFGSSFEAKQRQRVVRIDRDPWKKPKIVRQK